MTVAVPIIRLICDIVTFFFAQIPIREAMHEYSLSHVLAMALADLMAIVWIPEILQFANIGSDAATVLSVFMLALIAYSLLLMTVDTMSQLARSRSALKCIANVSDALPLPNQVPEETVVRRINRGLAHSAVSSAMQTILIKEDIPTDIPRLFPPARDSIILRWNAAF